VSTAAVCAAKRAIQKLLKDQPRFVWRLERVSRATLDRGRAYSALPAGTCSFDLPSSSSKPRPRRQCEAERVSDTREVLKHSTAPADMGAPHATLEMNPLSQRRAATAESRSCTVPASIRKPWLSSTERSGRPAAVCCESSQTIRTPLGLR